MAILRRDNQNNITNWQPMRSLMDDFMRMPDLWEDFSNNFGRSLSSDMWEDQDNVYIKISLPGVNPDDVEITFSKDTVTVKGETKEEEEKKEKSYYHKQIRTGSFMQTFSVPGNVNPDNADAKFDKGMLTITLPKSEEAKPKTIKINS